MYTRTCKIYRDDLLGPIGHSTISAGIGVGVWGITGSTAAGVAALGVGVLTDVDHLFDFYRWYLLRKHGKLCLLFHAWEYGIIGLLVVGLVFYHPILLGAVLAHLGHIATDHFHNRISPWGYFITYRAYVGFDAARVAPNQNVLNSYKSWPRLVPFGKRLEPWFQLKIEPWFQSRIGS
jgi:hypothetical protein